MKIDKKIQAFQGLQGFLFYLTVKLPKSTIKDPDYIFLDERRKDTGLIAKKISLSGEILYIVLRVCTDSENGTLANSVISGWKISESRLQNYIRHKQILYKKAQNK
jgi:hypothetical protein